MRHAIQTRGLHKDFGHGRGILDLDLEVHKGEVFGLIGPNGAGKTTTIRLLLDLLRPDRGSATIMGHDVRHDGVAARRQIGYLPGELSLYPALRGRQIIERVVGLRYPLGAQHQMHSMAERLDLHMDMVWDRVEWLAARLGADLDRPTGQLSSGNKQKIGLILAFLHDPQVLILDEPVTGLDPLVQREVQAMILEAKQAGRTVFLSSHNLPEVERLCDRVGIVRDGRMVEVKTMAELRRDRVNRLRFQFDGPVPRGVFDTIPHVAEVRYEGDVAHIAVTGAVDGVIKAAAKYTVIDVETDDPGLEEIFLAYYRDEGGARDV